jgi:hypothetical protein
MYNGIDAKKDIYVGRKLKIQFWEGADIKKASRLRKVEMPWTINKQKTSVQRNNKIFIPHKKVSEFTLIFVYFFFNVYKIPYKG